MPERYASPSKNDKTENNRMRKYIEYKNEISDSDLYEGLVGYGLFAEKIPNFLTSVDFLAYTQTLTFPINDKPKDFIRYSSMRNINIPRPMAIPEPFAYANQAKALSDNWTKLQNHFRDKTLNDSFKISRIHLRKLKKKSELFEMNYKTFRKMATLNKTLLLKANM